MIVTILYSYERAQLENKILYIRLTKYYGECSIRVYKILIIFLARHASDLYRLITIYRLINEGRQHASGRVSTDNSSLNGRTILE